MAFRSILTLLDNSKQCESWSAYAADLALQQGARLVGIVPRESASSLYVGDFISANSMWLAELQTRIDADVDEAIANFSALCEAKGLKQAVSHVVDGTATDAMRRESMFSDLIVLGQYLPASEKSGGTAGLVESLLLTTGCPLLVVPALGEYQPETETILVAWRESKESSLAIRQSLPLLSLANSVEVVEVSTKADTHTDDTRRQVLTYLRLHGVEANQRRIISSIDAGDVLLSHACDTGAQLMVMGGYGHARLKEWVIGGVTKTILGSMTLPVPLSH